jgi:hypothetical protein
MADRSGELGAWPQTSLALGHDDVHRIIAGTCSVGDGCVGAATALAENRDRDAASGRTTELDVEHVRGHQRHGLFDDGDGGRNSFGLTMVTPFSAFARGRPLRITARQSGPVAQ